MTTHKMVLIDNYNIRVDELLAPLFKIIWPLNIRTLHSCQGRSDDNLTGYITFASASDLIKFIHHTKLPDHHMLRIVYGDPMDPTDVTKIEVTYDELIQKQYDIHLRTILNFNTCDIPAMIDSIIY